MREDSADYREILLQGFPMLDVRAPVEFRKGAFPGAVNLPLLDDLERQKVGTCYQQQGPRQALELGHRLVSGPLREARLTAWTDFARHHPQGYLYCFRGGLRSQIVQQWMAEAGYGYPRVRGGYKALRTFLIDTLESTARDCDLWLLGGLTGTGKTEVLARTGSAIDLERHAHHRGSSFGKRATPQPTQIDFENHLAIDILRLRATGCRRFVLEDEGPSVGSCSLPFPLYQRMQQAPVVWLEDTFEARVERILQDYVVQLRAEFIAHQGPDQGASAFAAQLHHSLRSIARRLGGECFQRLLALLTDAIEVQHRSGSVHQHRAWIAVLLQEYYDPMYLFQLKRKQERIVFRGTQAEIQAYLREIATGMGP